MRMSDLTGYAAVRVPLQKASRPGEVTLDLHRLPAGRHLRLRRGGVGHGREVPASAGELRAHPRGGGSLPGNRGGNDAGHAGLALAAIGVSRKTHLTFDDICDAIDAGRPVMVCVKTNDQGQNTGSSSTATAAGPTSCSSPGKGCHFIAASG